MGKTVTRVELSAAIYKASNLSRSASVKMVELVLKQIIDALEKGETVKLSSFAGLRGAEEGPAHGPQPQERHRGADLAAPRARVQALCDHEAAGQHEVRHQGA